MHDETNVFKWYNLQRNSQGKKKSKNCNAHRSFSVLMHNIIYNVYECFGQYCELVSIVTRGETFANMIGFPSIARDEIPMLKYL